MPKKYKNYRELSDAFKSGELDKNKYYLMLDKSGTENTLCFRYDESLSDVENEREQDRASAIFPGDHPVEELFDALEIPNEWC